MSDTTISMPPNAQSVIYLVTAGASNVTMTLPAAASATSRFVTIQRVDQGKKVFVFIKAQNNESIDGARKSLTMDGTLNQVTLVTDGVEWVVWSHR